MNVLHLLYRGAIGGIEQLCKDILNCDDLDNNFFLFASDGGEIYDEMCQSSASSTILLGLKNTQLYRMYVSLCKIVKEKNIDVILVHHDAPLLWLPVLLYLRNKARAKVIVYFHNNYEVYAYKKKWRKKILDRILTRADAVIAISESVKNSILDGINISSRKIFVVYNGIQNHTPTSCIKNKYGNIIKILFLGRLIKEKGVHLLIEAIYKSKYKERIIVDIVGDGPCTKNLKELVAKYKLENVFFHGSQRNTSHYYEEADMFVHPAIWEEGFGITIVEAMSYGLVCVAFRRGAIPEIIQDKKNGFLVDEDGAVALSKKIDSICEMILSKDNNIEMIRSNAVERSLDFSIEKMCAALHEVYISLLTANNR